MIRKGWIKLKPSDESVFKNRLKELVAIGKKKKGVLEYKEIMDYLGDVELDADGMPPHGYGVRTVRAAAQKYSGTVTVHCEDNWFILRILLPHRPGGERGIQQK